MARAVAGFSSKHCSGQPRERKRTALPLRLQLLRRYVPLLLGLARRRLKCHSGARHLQLQVPMAFPAVHALLPQEVQRPACRPVPSPSLQPLTPLLPVALVSRSAPPHSHSVPKLLSQRDLTTERSLRRPPHRQGLPPPRQPLALALVRVWMLL